MEIDPDLEEMIDDIIHEAYLTEKRPVGDLNVVLGDDDLLRKFNKEYHGIDRPTDVLAFDLSDERTDEIEGDIYISVDRARDQAKSAGITVEKEILCLVIHGFLHLCGHDHFDDVSLQNMVSCGEKHVCAVIQRNFVGY